MSSRRDRERSPKTRLRMDSYQGRNGRGSSRNREREIDSVMKKARSQRSGSQSTYWNKKLLEAEEKDPNRWRHSGYKELYHGDKRGSRSHSESGSLSNSKSRSKSPLVVKSPRQRVRSPKIDSRAKSPERWSPRRHSRGRISFSRSPRNSPARTRVRSPKRSSVRRESRERRRVRSPRRSSRDKSLERSRSPRVRRRSPVPRTPPRRPPSPRAKCRSESCSSESSSSCSNDSCSVCSPKRKSSKEREPKRTKPERRSIERKHRERVKARHRVEERSRSRSIESRSRGEKVPVKRKVLPDKSMHRSPFIKVESDSDSSSRESVSGAGAVANGPRISLSERFGRMAQWSVDRDLELRNLRITADRDRFTVEMDNPPSPLYPPSLSTINEFGSSWDDIRVRYAYYKERGYLRDLTLQDYVKWEQWWYKYQDWLENDSYYDRYHYYRRRP